MVVVRTQPCSDDDGDDKYHSPQNLYAEPQDAFPPPQQQQPSPTKGAGSGSRVMYAEIAADDDDNVGDDTDNEDINDSVVQARLNRSRGKNSSLCCISFAQSRTVYLSVPRLSSLSL